MDEKCPGCGAVFADAKAEVNPAPQRRDVGQPTNHCKRCRRPVSFSDVYCRSCGSSVRGAPKSGSAAGSHKDSANGGLRALALPNKREKKTVLDWRKTGRQPNDFLEK